MTVTLTSNAARSMAARSRGLQHYRERAIVRAALSGGQSELADVLRDAPESIRSLPLWQVIGWARYIGTTRMASLNERAVGDGINLAKPIAWCSQRELDWVARQLFPRSGHR